MKSKINKSKLREISRTGTERRSESVKWHETRVAKIPLPHIISNFQNDQFGKGSPEVRERDQFSGGDPLEVKEGVPK